jgi:hypothetical protein
MKKFLSFIFFPVAILTLFSIKSSAQGTKLDWLGWLKTKSNTNTYKITTDQFDNVYMVGIFKDTCDFDPGSGIYQLIEHHTVNGNPYDIFVIKVNPQGNLIWGFRVGGDQLDQVTDVLVTASGKLFICGTFKDSMDVDPGPNTYTLTATGTSNDAFLCEYDTSGNFHRAIRVGSSGSESYSSVAVDKSGNIYTTMSYSTAFDADPGPGVQMINPIAASEAALCKFDSAGNYLWLNRFTSTSFVGVGNCLVDDSGYVYVQGRFQMSVDCNPCCYTLTAAAGWPDGLTAKYDSAGVFQWAFRTGNTSSVDDTYKIRQDASGNLVFLGRFTGTLDVDPDTSVYNISTTALANAYIAVVDRNANFIRALHLKGDESKITWMGFDSTGCLYISGYFDGMTDFDPGPDYFYVQTNGDRDFFFSKYDPDYNHLWTKTIGSKDYDLQYAFATCGDGAFYGVGGVTDTTDFEPGGGANIVVPINYDMYVAKWIPCFGDSSVITDSVCFNYTSPKGNVYTTSGTYREMFLNSSHCDSMVIMHLGIFQPIDSTVYISSCHSYTSSSGNTWDSSGIYLDTIPRLLGGCDSVLTLYLTIGEDTSVSRAITACQSYLSPSGNYLWTTSGIYHDTIATYLGCDSVINILLTINSVDTTVSLQPPYLVANAASAIYQWMYCDSSILAGEVNQNLLADSNEWFAVIVTQNGCVDTSACYSLSTVSTSEISAPDNFTLTPNPSIGIILIDRKELEMYSMDFYNALGQKVFSKENCRSQTQVDISSFDRGCYIVVLIGNKSVYRKKIIKD